MLGARKEKGTSYGVARLYMNLFRRVLDECPLRPEDGAQRLANHPLFAIDSHLWGWILPSYPLYLNTWVEK